MWKLFQKRRAMRAYRGRLGIKLRNRYGRARYYTVEQVETTARDNGFATDYLCFALALYCERDELDAYHAERGEVCDYDGMRTELGAHCHVASWTVDTPSSVVGDGARHEHDIGHHHGHDVGGHDVGAHDGGDHDFASSDIGGGDFGGGDFGGGDFSGGDF